MLNFLFLTTHNLVTNPRLVKEINLCNQQGNKVTVICFEFKNWSFAINNQLIKKLASQNVTIISIPAGRSPFLPWLWSVATERFFRLAGFLFSLPVSALSQAISRRSCLLVQAAQKVSKPDWVIGHNPGALWPALKTARQFNCAAGFDVEDYHPGEGNNKPVQTLTKKLMAVVLPQMNYVSFASPLIRQEVKNDLGAKEGNWFTLLNYFPSSDFRELPVPVNGPVKLVWFSQNIAAGRGLELILPAVKHSGDKAELHLIGNLDPLFYENYLTGFSNIIIHTPLEQKELHQKLAEFDIGLALEPAKDKNNELAISNKMLAYLQAGLFVVATNTAAQESFLAAFPGHGLCFEYKINNSEIIFEKITGMIASIRNQRSLRYANFKNKNWEMASLDLLAAWNK